MVLIKQNVYTSSSWGMLCVMYTFSPKMTILFFLFVYTGTFLLNLVGRGRLCNGALSTILITLIHFDLHLQQIRNHCCAFDVFQ